MDEDETAAKGQEQLDRLAQEISDARRRLDEATHTEEEESLFFEDDQGPGEEGPGNDNVPA